MFCLPGGLLYQAETASETSRCDDGAKCGQRPASYTISSGQKGVRNYAVVGLEDDDGLPINHR